MSLGPAASFLSEVIEPPPPKAVTASLEALVDVGAITLGGPVASDSGAAALSSSTAAAAVAGGVRGGSGGAAAAAGSGNSTAAAAGGGAAGAAAERAQGGADGGVISDAPSEALTPLGRHLALLPLEPRLGKLLVMGACLGCLAPALVGRW